MGNYVSEGIEPVNEMIRLGVVAELQSLLSRFLENTLADQVLSEATWVFSLIIERIFRAQLIQSFFPVSRVFLRFVF